MINKKDREDKQKTAETANVNGGFKRLKRKNSTKLFKQRLLYVILLVLLSAVFLVIAVALFFRVSKIKVEGNSLYNDDEIIAASGIVADMNIYLVDETEVGGNIISEYPYVRKVSVLRHIPSTVVLQLECDSPDYYIEINGQFFVISEEQRVLQRFMTKEELLESYPDVIKLTAGDVQSAIVGHKIAYVDDSYKSTGEEVLSALKKSEMYSGISSVDLTDRFNIYVVYDSRLKTNIGNTDDLELKLRFLNEIINDLGDARGTIDLKDVEAGYVLLNSTEIYD